MSELYGMKRVDAMFHGPARPDSRDGGSGIDENAIHIDKQARAMDFGHRIILMKM
jgi:hypothetical protein